MQFLSCMYCCMQSLSCVYCMQFLSCAYAILLCVYAHLRAYAVFSVVLTLSFCKDFSFLWNTGFL